MADQSAKDYLLSREGRPALIGAASFLLVAPVLAYYSISAMYPDDEAERTPSTQEQRAALGESSVEANSTSQIRPDLTSQGMTAEAREALQAHNERAYAEGRLGQPTPDDVQLIDVGEEQANATPARGLPTENGNEESQGRPDEGAGNAEPGAQPSGLGGDQGEIIGYTADGQAIYAAGSGSNAPPSTPRERRERQKMRDARLEAMRAEHAEYRSRRLAAAVELINYESSPATVASLSFGRQSAEASGTRKLPHIVQDGNGQTRLVKGNDGGSSGDRCEHPLVRGGEIRYAQSDIALNTDFAGPVRMTFLEGNLRGYVGMGSFELNELGAKMKLKIDRLFDPDGQSYSVSGYVLDPNTTLWAMASDVDHHIIYRYGGFGLGTILNAFSILAENRATRTEVVTPEGTRTTENREPDGKQVTWTLLGEFSNLFEQAFKDNLNRPITVTLNPNEEAGVLFEDTVCELNTQISKDRRAQERRDAMGYGDPLS